MHGGNPKSDEVYGYTAWLAQRGYISIHNPSAVAKEYTIKLDREFGLHPSSTKTTFLLSSPIADCTKGLKEKYSYGDSLTLTLHPQEIRILNFDVTAKNWKVLTDLQTRTKEDYIAPPKPKPIPVKGHAVLGIWKYGPHTREVKTDGTCTLTSGKKFQWTKPFTVKSKKKIIVEGNTWVCGQDLARIHAGFSG